MLSNRISPQLLSGFPSFSARFLYTLVAGHSRTMHRPSFHEGGLSLFLGVVDA